MRISIKQPLMGPDRVFFFAAHRIQLLKERSSSKLKGGKCDHCPWLVDPTVAGLDIGYIL